LDRIIGPGTTNFETYLTTLASKVAALEAGGGGGAYTLTVVFRRVGYEGDVYINLKTDSVRYANYVEYSSQNTFTVTLPGDGSYLYVNLYDFGDYYPYNEGFEDGDLGEPYKFYDFNDGVYWARYEVNDKGGQTVYYDFALEYNP
jgi:hypothetical protein